MHITPDAVKIKRWREERSWSQEHLADAAGISLRTIQRIENGDGASRESVMALAAAFNVDALALTVDARTEASKITRKDRNKTRDGFRMAFLISLASYIFGLILFTGISLSDGVDGYVMLFPAIWWGVGTAGLGLGLIVMELVTHYKQKAEATQ
ncbi:MAG: XRE family transcriptional regulator [Robiginitomaculum sp.]|nr:MAG: XRE family transcriptional regulator [Robiginitomaculum sp.]